MRSLFTPFLVGRNILYTKTINHFFLIDLVKGCFLISIQFDPETTSDVVHRVEVSRLDCVLACLQNGGKARDRAEHSDRKPCMNRTALVISVLF